MDALDKLVFKNNNSPREITALEASIIELRESPEDYYEWAQQAAAELAEKDATIAALRERVEKLEDGNLISGNILDDVEKYLEIEIKTCNGVGMEYEIGLLDSIDAFMDSHSENIKAIREKAAALRGDA